MSDLPNVLEVVTTTPVAGHRPLYLLFLSATRDRPMMLRKGVICAFRSMPHMRSYLRTTTDRPFRNAEGPNRENTYPFEPWQCMQLLRRRRFKGRQVHNTFFWTAAFGIIALRCLKLKLPRKYDRALNLCADVLTFDADTHAWIDKVKDLEQAIEAFGLLGATVYARIELAPPAK